MGKTAGKGKSATKNNDSTRVKRVWMKSFLAVLSKTGNVTKAATAAKIDRSTAYDNYKTDTRFKQQWEDALDQAADILEDEAWRRAVKGCRRPVYQGGELVGYIQEYSDTLMCLLLKAHKPKKYRERSETQIIGDFTPAVIAVEGFTGWKK